MTTIDPELQAYFEDYLDLFIHPGWVRFITDLRDSLDHDQKTMMTRCKTTDEMLEERGAQLKTSRILTFETLVRNQYDQLVADSSPEEE